MNNPYSLIKIKDIDKEIILKTEKDEDFLTWMRLNKYFCSLFDEIIFKKRMKLKYPDIKRNKKREVSWKRLYLRSIHFIKVLKTTYNFEFKTGDPEKYIKILSKPTSFIFQAYHIGKYGYVDLLQIVFPSEFNFVLQGAARGGHWKLIKHSIFTNIVFRDQDYNDALCEAIKHNRRDIIDYFISLGANDWQEFINEASEHGHKDLIQLFKSLSYSK